MDCLYKALSNISRYRTVTPQSTTNYSFRKSDTKVTFECLAFYLLTEDLVLGLCLVPGIKLLLRTHRRLGFSFWRMKYGRFYLLKGKNRASWFVILKLEYVFLWTQSAPCQRFLFVCPPFFPLINALRMLGVGAHLTFNTLWLLILSVRMIDPPFACISRPKLRLRRHSLHSSECGFCIFPQYSWFVLRNVKTFNHNKRQKCTFQTHQCNEMCEPLVLHSNKTARLDSFNNIYRNKPELNRLSWPKQNPKPLRHTNTSGNSFLIPFDVFSQVQVYWVCLTKSSWVHGVSS